jgi:hypothetical protein
VAEEGEGECGSASDAATAGAQGTAESRDIGRAKVGQFVSLEISPEQFDRVEIWGIRGKPFATWSQ